MPIISVRDNENNKWERYTKEKRKKKKQEQGGWKLWQKGER